MDLNQNHASLNSSFRNFAGSQRPMDETQFQRLIGVSLHQVRPSILMGFAKRLPKIELHQHLEGSITPKMMLELAQRHHVALPAQTVHELMPFIQVTDKDSNLDDFLSKFPQIDVLFKSYALIEELTALVLANAAQDNVRYIELRFSPSYMCKRYKLEMPKVVEAVLAGMQDAEGKLGIKSKAIILIERQLDLTTAAAVGDLAVAYAKQGVVALDLANDELRYPPKPFADIFLSAKKAGLNITVHAGEAAGAENVEDSIRLLGADRIGHGVRIVNNPAVMQLVKEVGCTLELCYTSNHQTGAVAKDIPYPLKAFLEQGLKVTVNTDDPGISRVTLSREWFKVIRACSLELTDVAQLLQNSVDAAFVSQREQEKMKLLVQEEFASACQWLVARVANAC
ncbi:MAG: adenosine deaminase [Bdellovibrionales bacterium]|nr:adenosine deaminase [Bdellovibrionales bacterium]